MYPQRDSSFAAGNPDSLTRVVIFHGYTGSTDEFESLAHAMAEKMNAYVWIPLLPGHGTNEADLIHLTYDDFITFAEREVKKVQITEGKFIVIGHSFGGYLAMECAEKFKADALVLTVVPFQLRFPLNIPGMAWLMRRRLLWDKKLPLQEKIERLGLFYYNYMPGIALTLLNVGIERSKKALRAIRCPILCVHTAKDPLTYSSSGDVILALSGKNQCNRSRVVPREEHGLFYGNGHDEIVAEIVAFIDDAIT